jgi:hypothetical protein
MSIILHSNRSLVAARRRVNSSLIGQIIIIPATYILGGLSGTAITGTLSVPASTSNIKVYACAGGGSAVPAPGVTGGNGAGGGEAQLNGYTVGVIPGEVLSYSVGSYEGNTFITRAGTTIFNLSAGSPLGAALAVSPYGSHSGGAGGGGGARYSNGNNAPAGTIIGGGGGGGGYGDTSPLTGGGAGGNGGAGPAINIAKTIAGVGVTFISALGGNGGSANSNGANVNGAFGGLTASTPPGIWNGGGGGAGGGIKVSAFPSSTIAYGGGGGGAGSVSTGGKGGAGFLIVEYI